MTNDDEGEVSVPAKNDDIVYEQPLIEEYAVLGL